MEDRTNVLLTFYSEAWKQYSHEDDQAHKRNTVFLSIQTALFAIVAGLASGILSGRPDIESAVSVDSRWMLLGVTGFVIGVFAEVVNLAWKGANARAKAYTWCRQLTAQFIEHELKEEGAGLASIEHRWRSTVGEDGKRRYTPFPDHPVLSSRSIPELGQYGSWNSTDRIIAGLSIIWGLVIMSGLFIFASKVCYC